MTGQSVPGQSVPGQRVPGPPAPAFTPRPPVAQARGRGDSFQVDPARLGLASGGGRSLPDGVRGKMEAALGADFSAVRVHVGPQAERIGAVAFTMGSDIYFAPGRFQPNTVQGQQLLGHELAHVVQQRQGRVRNPMGSGVAVVQDRALEAEADRLGHRAASYGVGIQAKTAPGSPGRLSAVRSFGANRRWLGANVRGLQPSMLHAAVQSSQRSGRGGMRHQAATRTGVVQRDSVGEQLVEAVRDLADPLRNLRRAIGVGSRLNLVDVLLDPAYDPRGAVAINQQVFESNLENPLDFASCYPTAEALFPLLSQSVREGGVLYQGANRNTYGSGADFRQQVELLVGAMTRAEGSDTEYVFRIEFAGHGFTLIGTPGGAGGAYQFELIESLAHTAAIGASLVRQNRIFTPAAAYQNLRDMADDNVDTRVAGAAAMGWNGNMLYLGRDPNNAGHVDFPAVRMKWWASKLSREWGTRWGAQIRDRFNYLAELYGIDDRI
jgi:hypothetical protein